MITSLFPYLHLTPLFLTLFLFHPRSFPLIYLVRSLFFTTLFSLFRSFRARLLALSRSHTRSAAFLSQPFALRFSICVAPFLFFLLFSSFLSPRATSSQLLDCNETCVKRNSTARGFKQLTEQVIYQTGNARFSRILLEVKKMSLLMRASCNLNNGFTRWLDEEPATPLFFFVSALPVCVLATSACYQTIDIQSHIPITCRSRYRNPKRFGARLFQRNNTVYRYLNIF